jgi:MHS family proline/betaine transporter-like MFS transporter
MAESGQEPTADPAAIKRHPVLFRTIEQRRNPKLRRTDITVTDEAAVRRAVKAAVLTPAPERPAPPPTGTGRSAFRT